MLQHRVIPTLLLKNTGLVKTKKFKKPTYIGDPINAVKIFNDKGVDEIVFLDITKTLKKEVPNYELIEEIANECFVPFAYGGGIKSLDSIRRILKLGAEKVVLNSITFYNPELITEAKNIFGSQSIVVSIDYKKNFFGVNKVYIENGKKNTGFSPLEYALKMEELGAGEIFMNSIEREGTRTGYDIDVLKLVSNSLSIPVIASGGANSIEDMKKVINQSNVSAVAAGSMFVYYGDKDGVLINYPDRTEISSLNQANHLEF
jgi:cyclase